ncbi:MAG: polynucleotide adenylyltransferase PcnB [Lysobacteraceae bacterium]
MDSSRIQPRVIPREDHGISRKQISPNALRVLYRLHEAGFSAFLVGGAVRDLLVGGAPKDFDVATDATPDQVRALFRNCRLIGRRFRLAHVVYGPEIIEVATFRAGEDDGSGDREIENGVLVRDNVYGSIEDDAVRRDFTANALYYAISDFSVRDFVGGYEDVQAGRLRLIGDPATRYREDPVRMLRAARLSAKLGFEIESATAAPIADLAFLLEGTSSARLFDESLKLFMMGHAQRSFDVLEGQGLLPVLLPELAKALCNDPQGQCRSMVRQALATTDERVATDKPVTPAFLFAALLWPAYASELHRLLMSGAELAVAEQRAADRVTLRQTDRLAIPKRFTVPMHEIWWLQSRFPLRQRKRVLRLLHHPRFRAAFDFLELRAHAAPELNDEVAWWREAQSVAVDALVERLQPKTGRSTPTDSEGGARSGRRRKPRRRAAPST